MRLPALPDRWRALLAVAACLLLAGGIALAGMHAGWPVQWTLLASLAPWLLLAGLVWRFFSRDAATRRALLALIAGYRDGDYSHGLAPTRNDMADLVEAHNALGNTLREQRLALVQRELLLDTVVQNTPVALLVVDAARRVVLANLAARRLLGDGTRLEGRSFEDIVDAAHPALGEAIARGGDALFNVGGDEDDDEDVVHLSRRGFRLNGKPHELFLLRQLTAELRRQEVQTWKKVIRVISHELNNSLAPIASLAHSSRELLRRAQPEKLPQALATIEERARHLEGFIRDYARFAKLPAPRREPVQWGDFLAALATQMPFRWNGEHRAGIARIDVPQMEQALLNLLKNAHESGSAADAVELGVRRLPDAWRIDVLDRGAGMGEAVILQALLPFYSTKRNGTGLGLALAREIAEAHGGRISLANRDGGGLGVSITVPDTG